MNAPAPLLVSNAEAGLKLLRFLERRLESHARGALHKWIRTGQVRVNGRRAKAFDPLCAGDMVRVPPFAREPASAEDAHAPHDGATSLDKLSRLGRELCLVHAESDYLVLGKAGGFAAQGGDGHADNAASRLKLAFERAPYVPAPAHRLDRDTSGLLLAGRSAKAQAMLHALFRHGGIVKDYLAWVDGAPPWQGPRLLLDRLEQARLPGTTREGMRATPGGHVLDPACLEAAGQAADFIKQSRPENNPLLPPPALCLALPLAALPEPPPAYGAQSASLLLVRLLTGRKHQIRVQLASRGLPVLGDKRYGRHPHALPMLLHAWRLRFFWPSFPDAEQGLTEGQDIPREYMLPPDWPAPLLPDMPAVEDAARVLDSLHDALPADNLLEH